MVRRPEVLAEKKDAPHSKLQAVFTTELRNFYCHGVCLGLKGKKKVIAFPLELEREEHSLSCISGL